MASRGAAKKAPPRKKKGGYKMPPPIPSGEVLADVTGKKKWRIGPSIGVGGFGEIYSACDDAAPPKSSANYPYAVKIEPHENGPLFCEKNFYTRNVNKDDIASFATRHKLPSVGVPAYYGSGSHTYKGENFRYLVIEKYGQNIWSLFEASKRSFPAHTVFLLGLQMLEVLEYIHNKGYIHADIKGGNILLGVKKGTENQAYLLDYGLARKAAEVFKPNPKCAHDGTIEYTSRDAHLGCPTMRGDLEILAYNLLQWLAGSLPWEKSLSDPKKVQQAKEDFMSDVRAQIKKNYPSVPGALVDFFEYIDHMNPEEMPDYVKCRKIFETYLKSQGCSRTSKLEFTSKTAKTTKKTAKRTSEDPENGDDERTNGEEIAAKKTKKTVKTQKRKSTDTLVVNSVKKVKLTPRISGTPPAKTNHINIATQTSTEKRKSPRVKFDSPVVTSVISPLVTNGRARRVPDYRESSPDMFDDSFEANQKKKPQQKKLLAEEKVVVKRKVTKKTTTGKSWRDAPTVVNGKRPPVS